MDLSAESTPEAVLSARGTKLNRKGRETRQVLLQAAVDCLADGGPDAVSANAVARRAGATWGTIQHQFGDADGLWAAVLDHIAARADFARLPAPSQPGIGERVEAVVDLLWRSVQLPDAVAFYQLRAWLPHRRDQLEESFPRTAQAIARWDQQWAALCDRSFAGLGVDGGRLLRVRHLLPAALRGLVVEGDLGGYVDVDEARRGLTEALTAYLR